MQLMATFGDVYIIKTPFVNQNDGSCAMRRQSRRRFS
jgi:hypothetical protein